MISWRGHSGFQINLRWLRCNRQESGGRTDRHGEWVRGDPSLPPRNETVSPDAPRPPVAQIVLASVMVGFHPISKPF
jgi:hypothetical protein